MSTKDLEYCKEDDLVLEKLTSMRFVAMAMILGYRTYKIKSRGAQQAEYPDSPYREHPKITEWMNGSNHIIGLFYAGCLFIQSEGVGFAIYFSVSSLMDNYTIYLADQAVFCEYVSQAALYSMALITFLPTCLVAYYLQGRWYDNGNWLGKKTAFILLMVVVTMASFVIRYALVYQAGWAGYVDYIFEDSDYRVVIAVLMPPVVDALQTLLLIAAAVKTQHTDSKKTTYIAVDEGSSSANLCP